MSSLKVPFKVLPKTVMIEVGNATTGVIDIQSFLYLHTAEKMLIEKSGLLDVPKAIAKLAKKICEVLNAQPPKDEKGFGKKISLVQINDAIARRVNGDEKKADADLDLIGDFLEELMEIQDRIVAERAIKIQVYAHAVYSCRFEQQCTIEELEKALGSALMSRVGLFAIYEELGIEYKETPDEEPPVDPKPAELSEEDVLK
jgi:RNA-binding protein YhbY